MYPYLTDWLENNYEEVDCYHFYRQLFPEGSFEKKGEYEDGKYNGIAVSISKGAKRANRYTITDDLDMIEEIAMSNDFCIMSPISYAGKSRKSENGRFIYALAIDLDGIEKLENIIVLNKQIDNNDFFVEGGSYWGLPTPTYLVSSGTGLHIYYFFEKPIPLFPNIVKQLEKLKRRLTWQAWTQGASELHDNVQFESLFQGFRMVGSITKNSDRVRAFKVGDKVSLEYLNYSVPLEYRATEFTYKSDLRLEDAKKKYPEWYERRVVAKKPKGTWICKRDLYDWWKRRYYEARQGHRYWYVMTLAVYAKKCNIDRNELEKDAFELMPRLDKIGTEPFTEDDVIHALEAYNDSYMTYPIHTIISRTNLPIEKNKRNGRKQKQHIQIISAIRDIEYPNGKWRNGNGRPLGSGTAENKIKEWRSLHPEGTKKQCKDDTGLSYPTIRKWWS